MRIKSVDDGDFHAIAAIVNPYIQKTSIHFGTEPVSADEMRADWRATRERYGFLIASVGDDVAGFAKAGVFRTRPAYQWTTEIGVYVDERYQRRGIARALYQRLLALCTAQGFHVAIAGITLPNDPSVRLHEALGFTRVATFREVGHKLGAWHDVGFWQLALSSSTTAPSAIQAPALVDTALDAGGA